MEAVAVQLVVLLQPSIGMVPVIHESVKGDEGGQASFIQSSYPTALIPVIS